MAGSIFDRVVDQVSQQAAERLRVPQVVNRAMPLARAITSGDGGEIVNKSLDQLFGPSFGNKSILGFDLGGLLGTGSSSGEVIGGISLKRAREIFEECAATKYARKNLWFISIRDLKAGQHAASKINLFATEVSYNVITVSGEPVRVGSGSFDTVNNSERVELRVTTMDSEAGDLKKWFKERTDRLAHSDGTFGLPIDYLMKIEILHAYMDAGISGAEVAYKDAMIMRPGDMAFDLSRREQGMQEIQMSFVQFDTFTNLAGQ